MTDGESRARAPAYRPGRMEAFSDGVFAIAVTLLVLEIAVPTGSEDDLRGSASAPSSMAMRIAAVLHVLVEEHQTFVRLALKCQVLVRHEERGAKGLVERQCLGNRVFRQGGSLSRGGTSSSCHRHVRKITGITRMSGRPHVGTTERIEA